MVLWILNFINFHLHQINCFLYKNYLFFHFFEFIFYCLNYFLHFELKFKLNLKIKFKDNIYFEIQIKLDLGDNQKKLESD